MEALSERPGATAAPEDSPSPKKQRQLSLLQSACDSLADADGSGPLAMSRPRADHAPPHDDADAFFEYDVEDGGTAASAATTAGGGCSGGADTGCAVTSPVDGSFDLSMSPLPMATATAASAAAAAAPSAEPEAAASAPLATHPPIPIPTHSNGRRHSNGTDGRHQGAAAGIAASNGQEGEPGGAAAARPGQAPTSPHVQQSPSERVDAWLRACASDSSTSADDEYGTPDEDMLVEGVDYGTPQFHVEMDTTDEAVLESADDGEGQAAVDADVVNVRQLLAAGCRVVEEDDAPSNGARRNGSGARAVGESGGAVVLDVSESPADVARVVGHLNAGDDPVERAGANLDPGEIVQVLEVRENVDSGHEVCIVLDRPQAAEDAVAGAEGGAVGGAAPEEVGTDDGSASANSSDFVPPDVLKRSCSLKSGKTPPCTPGRKKFVRFADAMGLDLQRVHTFRDEVPTVPAAAFRGLDPSQASAPAPSAMPPPPTTFQMSFSSSSAAAVAGVATVDVHSPHLVPMFLQPGGSLGFTDQLHRDRVRLETVVCRDGEWAVRGVVRVLNMDFHKSVRVRYTLDNWQTEREVEATYVHGSCDGLSDRFSFRLDARGLSHGGQLQFAVCFNCRGDTYWDSNGGRNYVVQLHELGPSRPYGSSPPSDWTDGRY